MPQLPSPARTAGRCLQKALPLPVSGEEPSPKTESAPTMCQEEANLSKDELCCKVKHIVQLLRLVDHLSLNVQQLLHRVLQLLAGGEKLGKLFGRY